jgi:hypothetical protein
MRYAKMHGRESSPCFSRAAVLQNKLPVPTNRNGIDSCPVRGYLLGRKKFFIDILRHKFRR